MAQYTTLKNAIQSVVTQNGNEEITGLLLQSTLITMINSLGDKYQFAGVADISTTPGTPDQNVAYIAGPGTYPNFNSFVVPDGKMGVFLYDGLWALQLVTVGKNYDANLDEINAKIGSTGGNVTVNPQWERGAIEGGTGINQESTIRIRTVSYIPLANYNSLSIVCTNSDYSFAVFAYTDNTGTFDSNTGWLTSWNISNNQKFIRIVVRKNDNANVTTDIAQYISITGVQSASGILAALNDLTTQVSNKVSGAGELVVSNNYPRWNVGNIERPITDFFITMMSVDGNGAYQQMVPTSNNLGNTASEMLDITNLVITPNSDNVIFKVCFYDNSGNYLSATPYMARSTNIYVTAANVVQSYTISNKKCRIVVANITLEKTSRDKMVALSKINFSGVDSVIIVPQGYMQFQKVNTTDIFPNTNFRTRIDVAKENGIWKPVFSPYDYVLPTDDHVFISPDGFDTNDGLTPITPKKTIESAKSVGNTIVFLDGTYIAGVNFTNGVSISGYNLLGYGNVTIDNNNGSPIAINGDAFVDGIKFVNGNDGSLKINIGTTTEICCLSNCEFNNSVGNSNGGLVAMGGNIYVYKCKASGNQKDGFNYHKTTGNIIPHITEMYCEAYNNGNNDSYNSNNGSTAHDGALILRVSCKYGYCKGGVLADVNAGTISYNLGCVSVASSLKQSSSSDIPFMCSVYCGSGADIWLYDCALSGSKYDISCVDSGSKVHTNKQYPNNYTRGGGTILNIVE